MIEFVNLKDDKAGKDGEGKDEKEKKEKEPDFEILQNPTRVIKPQVIMTFFSSCK